MLPGQSVGSGPEFHNVVQLGNRTGTVVLDLMRGSRFELTATGDITLEKNTAGVPPGVTGEFEVLVKQDGVGGHEVSLGTGFISQGELVVNSAASGETIIECDLKRDGTVEVAVQAGAVSVVETYAGSGSYQPVAGDLNLEDGASGSYLAGVMGNVIADDLDDTSGMVAGIIGSYNIVTGAATTNPKGGVIGEVGDLSADSDGAVVAVLGGDSGQLVANAAFKAMGMNSTGGSGFDYGLDLYAPAHDGYNELAILKADIRCSNQVCWLNGAGAPVDGTTGDNVAGKGSLYTDITNGDLYIQTSAIGTPVWKLVTRAA